MKNTDKVEKLLDSVFLKQSDYEALVGETFSLQKSEVNSSDLRVKLSSGQVLFADTTRIVSII